jgi:hypothetical protein
MNGKSLRLAPVSLHVSSGVTTAYQSLPRAGPLYGLQPSERAEYPI